MLKGCKQNTYYKKGDVSMKRNFYIIALVLTILLAAGCSTSVEEGINPDDPIIVGSFVDTEGGILGNMVLLTIILGIIVIYSKEFEEILYKFFIAKSTEGSRTALSVYFIEHI